VKNALTELLHARARPSAVRLRGIVAGFADRLKEMPDPYYTVGQLVQLHWVKKSEREEGTLRGELEGFTWDMKDADDDFKKFVRDMDAEKQTPGALHWAFFRYYTDYKILLAGARRLARLLDVDLTTHTDFLEWRRLDDALSVQLRDVAARHEMAGLRELLEGDDGDGDWISRWR
jgi:hypothetical protein